MTGEVFFGTWQQRRRIVLDRILMMHKHHTQGKYPVGLERTNNRSLATFASMLRKANRRSPTSPPARSFSSGSLKGNAGKHATSGFLWVSVVLTGAFVVAVSLGSFRSTSPNTMGGVWSSLRKAHRSSSTCSFRKYPSHRYFKMNERPLPSFLTQSSYIYGEFPTLLPVLRVPPTKKLCVDQSSWWKSPSSTMLPFADGTNPSILRIRDNQNIKLPAAVGFGPNVMYLATICMTNSQCAWKDTPEQVEEFHISNLSKPTTVRTVLLVLDESFQVLEETTVSTWLDAEYGRRRTLEEAAYETFPLDDARLFTFQENLFVSYRDGPNFGYDKQVLNRVHLTREADGLLKASLLASEVNTLCCGRNMALIENMLTNKLQALTWVDPVTVVNVHIQDKQTNVKGGHITKRRLSDVEESRRRPPPPPPPQASPLVAESAWNQSWVGVQPPRRRLLSSGKKGSDFHGTNGFMVYLPQHHEYLGIGHFHRPPGRQENDYARFGHHYTHAFFTISEEEPFHLKRLSPELVLASDDDPQDAEVIQFWSGLERSNTDDDVMALTYGINDCEGAATYIAMKTIDDLLRDIPEGMEVSNMLEPLKKVV